AWRRLVAGQLLHRRPAALHRPQPKHAAAAAVSEGGPLAHSQRIRRKPAVQVTQIARTARERRFSSIGRKEMASMTGGKAVVESLGAEDTRHVFGLIGSAGMEIFDALYDAKDISFIGVRDERTGV